MSNAIAQSATNLSVSTNGEEQFDIQGMVSRIGVKNVKNLTRERCMINRQKLVSACCADYRMHFPAIYGKSERLASEVYEKIELAVEGFIQRNINQVHIGNATTMRKSAVHKAAELMFIERVTVVGENPMTLVAQRLSCKIAIDLCEKRLADLYAKKTPNYDLEKSTKETHGKLLLTLAFINREIEHQEKLNPAKTEPEKPAE